jgi:hypothetical protein
MEDRAEALANLPDPLISTCADRLRIVCISGGAGRQQASRDDSGDDDGGGGGNEQTPVVPGFASPRVTNCHQLTACGKMEAAELAPVAPIPQVVLTIASLELLVSDLLSVTLTSAVPADLARVGPTTPKLGTRVGVRLTAIGKGVRIASLSWRIP